SEYRHLFRGRTLAAGDDRPGMAHPFSRRSGDSGDVGCNRLGHVLLDEVRPLFFGGAADLADHDDRLRVRVGFEQPQDIQVIGAVDRVAADADAGGLAEAQTGQLPDRFVGEGAAPGDNTDLAGLVDIARHDADLALAGGDDAGAVGADESGLLPLHVLLDLDHVEDRNPFGDAADQFKAGIDRLHDGVGGKGGRYVDDRGGGAGMVYGVGDSVIDGEAVYGGPPLARGDPADHLGAVLSCALGMEETGGAGDPLGDDPGILVDQYAHFLPPFTAETIFWAASAMPSAATMFRPLSARISLPRATLVPSRRTTSGTLRETCLAASTTPVAMMSHFMMPPKMLTRIPLTFL